MGAARGVASVETMEFIDGFIDRLPKVELHVHLVGSASVSTVLELARRHPDGAGVPQSAAELAAFYEFRDFPHFADVYAAVSRLVRDPADVAELVLGAARDLAGQNVRYAELTVTPYTFTVSGMPAAGLTEALDIAARSARRDHGVLIAYIFDIAGELGEPAARATLEHALARPPEALTGFGLAGIKQARPAYREVFRSVFGAAIAAGLHSVPHAGEMSGPATIWEAVDGFRARAGPPPASRPGRQRRAGIVPGRRGQAGAGKGDRGCRGGRSRSGLEAAGACAHSGITLPLAMGKDGYGPPVASGNARP